MKKLKLILTAVMIFVTAISFVACQPTNNNPESGNKSDVIAGDEEPGGGNESETSDGGNKEEGNLPSDDEKTDILVVYFSCTNTTKGRAETLQSRLKADVYRIVPAVPYTSADLNYNDNSCRANREQQDANYRPEINGTVENIGRYDVVYIGYPIWWGQAPKIIYTFLESYDFSGVTIIPFCTSGGSGMGTSATNLHASAPDAIWKSGSLVRSASDIDNLVNAL